MSNTGLSWLIFGYTIITQAYMTALVYLVVKTIMDKKTKDIDAVHPDLTHRDTSLGAAMSGGQQVFGGLISSCGIVSQKKDKQ